MDDGSHYADLDLGDAGQTNGFDAWRLFDYAEQNKVDTPYKSVEEVEQAIKRAFQKDEIRFSGYILYYRIIRVVIKARIFFNYSFTVIYGLPKEVRPSVY